jgi:hypothetical protein
MEAIIAEGRELSSRSDRIYTDSHSDYFSPQGRRIDDSISRDFADKIQDDFEFKITEKYADRMLKKFGW